ncbi:serine/threonine-protein kinase [Sorangium sp. So ce131]|uniref:serine/threonine-protein kinase n=1 Tax=Sorangium sp. So ce131 TaxID=3133282 RepID=UPI003F5D9A7F
MSSNMTQDFEHASGERFESGAMIGDKYQLLRKAGEGAMGSVWVAANIALEANVAIKVLRPEMRSPAIAERLLREARAAAKLSHPGIVRVFDLGKTASGTPYIVMELLEGEALRDVLCREERLLPEAAIAILLPVASAMHAAHERGIVHRDLKPDNVMLAELGGGRIQPKVVDFGIAKVTWRETESGSTGTAVIGTPHYMPPEQALGHGHIDHRADVWALCTMLYEAIAGETPYAEEQGFGTLRAIVQDPAPSLVERCGTDPALWAIIERGLRKDPAERWGSMRELGVALATWLLSRGVSEDVCGASLRAQWLDERTSQIPVPAQSPRAAVSSTPTLHSRRAEDPMERPLPAVAASRRASAGAARRVVEESGERAWSESTVDLRNSAAAASMQPSSRGRFPFRRIAAAGFVLMAGAAAWSVAPVTGGRDAELSTATPAAPAATVAETPAPERPAAEVSSLKASMARGLVATPPAADPVPPRAAPRVVKAAAAAVAAAPAAASKPAAAAASSALPELPAVADAGAGTTDARMILAQTGAPGTALETGSAPCPAPGGETESGGSTACKPQADAAGNGHEVYEDAAAPKQEPEVSQPALEETPGKDAPGNDAPSAQAAQ